MLPAWSEQTWEMKSRLPELLVQHSVAGCETSTSSLYLLKDNSKTLLNLQLSLSDDKYSSCPQPF